MRTDPFTDTFKFLVGQQPDQVALGPWRWLLVLLFFGLLVGSAVLAVRNWQADPAQRSACLDLGGAHHDARDVVPVLAVEAPPAALWRLLLLGQPDRGERRMFFAVRLMLGFAVRLSNALVIALVLQLWLGLYRADYEWPWLFWFTIFTLGLFIVHGAGRSLGLDALLRREARLAPPAARLHALLS